MPRPLVHCNGRMYLAFDPRYRIRDFFYPQVGGANHLAGLSMRLGVWAAGAFSWAEDEGWTRVFSYEPDSMVANVTLANAGLAVRLDIRQALDPVKPWFANVIKVTNTSGSQREVRVFFNQDMHLGESDVGDCALYHPDVDAIIHYKGPLGVAFSANTPTEGIFQYAAGGKGHVGLGGYWLEGTFKDAEDGTLSNDPIAQGLVDSTLSARLTLPPGEVGQIAYWMVAADSFDAAAKEIVAARADGAEAIMSRNAAACSTYAKMVRERLSGLPQDVVDFCARSALLLRTQIAAGGAILAANDSDIMNSNRANYSYVWPRDGALVAQVLDEIGDLDTAGRYYEWCAPLITEERPYFLQKYRADGHFGASWHPWIGPQGRIVPLQEDETALTIVGVRDHLNSGGHVSEAVRQMVRRMAKFVLEYREPDTGLPKVGWDLWEERRGVHAYTVAAVSNALDAAADLFERWNEGEPTVYRQAATETREALVKLCHDAMAERLVRMINKQDGHFTHDTTCDASLLATLTLGAIPLDHRLAKGCYDCVVSTLHVPGSVGGISRYEHDWYHRRPGESSGNPWIICTMWKAQVELLRGDPGAKESAVEAIRWAARLAGPSGVLAEQYDPQNGGALSVSPLTWSHAEVLRTALMCVRP